MDDAAKHLLDRLEKALEDSRALGRLAIGTVVTLGLAILAAHGKGDQLVDGMLSDVGLVFGAITLISFALWSRALWLNNQEVERIVEALYGGANVIDPKPADPNLGLILDAKVQYRRRLELFLLRMGVVGTSLFLIWFHVADVPECIFQGRCGLPIRGEFPQTANVDGKVLRLNGIGDRKMERDRATIYAAGLYLETPEADPTKILASTGPKLIDMRFQVKVDRSSAESNFKTLISLGSKSPSSSLSKATDDFVKSLPDAKANDDIKLQMTSKGMIVTHSGHIIGSQQPPELGDAILRGLIAPDSSDEMRDELRRGLLGCNQSMLKPANCPSPMAVRPQVN